MIDESIQRKLREQYNPDGSALRDIQLGMLDILIEFDRVCRANSIQYWLDSGTLIGAIRHGGFIPWDDDLDVCMLKSDYIKYRTLINNGLRRPYTLCDVSFTPGYGYTYPRITDSSISVMRQYGNGEIRKVNIWMDILPMIQGTALFARGINKFYGRCFRRRYGVIDDGRLKHIVGGIMYPFAKCVVDVLRYLGRFVDKRNLDHDFGTGFYSKRKADDVFPLGNVMFENHIFPVPADCDSYLKRIYGDYMRLPDVDKRITHDFILRNEHIKS